MGGVRRAVRKWIIVASIAGAAVLLIVRPNVPRLALEAARHLFGQSVDSDRHIRQHDRAIARATDLRDSTKAIADSLEQRVVPPVLHRDSSARQELRHVLAVDSTAPLDVDSLEHALQVTTTAAARLDTTSTQAIGSLLALVAAKTAEASASDTLAATAQTALREERRDRNCERWLYRAKIAAGVLAGVGIGVIVHAL